MKNLMVVAAVVLGLSGCITSSKRDFDRTSSVGNVVFELAAVGKESGNYKLCRVPEVETKAREMTLSAFSRLQGQYRVVLERQSDAEIACWENRWTENLAQDATVVGLLLPDVYHPYALYAVRVFSGDRLVYQKFVKEAETSTKSALNLNKLNSLADESHVIFERTYAKVLSEAVSAVQRAPQVSAR